MISYRFAPRVAKVFVQLLPFLLLAGCTNAAVTKAKEPAEITLPPKGQQDFKAIETALGKFGLGQRHDSPCKGCPKPSDVTIVSTGKTKDIKASAGPAKRRIVALIENSSDYGVFHTPSKVTFKAHTKYLMWVGRDSTTGNANWGFIELGANYDPNPKALGLLVDCNHPTVSPTDDADFKDCSNTYSSQGWIKTAHAATTNVVATIEPAAWVACDPDCCKGAGTQR